MVSHFGPGALGDLMSLFVRDLLRAQGVTSADRPVEIHIGLIHPMTMLEMVMTRGGFPLGICGPMPVRGETNIDTSICMSFSLQLAESLKPEQVGITLAHESVHLCQMLTGKLRTRVSRLPSGHVHFLQNDWMGQAVPEGTPYMELPWEQEAHALQDTLTKEIGLGIR